jgi:hypothetical protein
MRFAMPRAWWSDAKLYAVLLAALTVIAFATPEPWWKTDRDTYLRIGSEFFVRDCAELHCFRVLVPWALERLPGPSDFWWHAYAVACQAAAGVAMARLVGFYGVSRHVSVQIAWLTALGSGALYTLFDPYSADPLMHWLAPTTTAALLMAQVARATSIASIGVFAKEFVVVPLAVVGIARAMANRSREAGLMLSGAAAVFGIWFVWQFALRSLVGYSTAASASTEFHLGSYVSLWLIELSPQLALASIVLTLGPLWLIWPAGLALGGRELRQMTFAALPVILIFCAVQQPDRALWNFAFLFMPAAAVVLEKVQPAGGWLLVATTVMFNLRVGAQLTWAPRASFGVAISGLVAVLILRRAFRSAPQRAPA